MGNKLHKIDCLLLVFIMMCISVSSQIYVKVRPVAPKILRTEILASGYTWIEEEWEPYDGNYRYSGCRWVGNRSGYRWKPGYWRRHHKYGEKWMQGKWR